MKNNLCYIVIANYNSYIETINCIDSILKSKYMLYKIIIVDDCSIDNSYDLLTKKYSDTSIKILRTSKNVGYGATNNIGLRYALDQDDCEYLWILNNDIHIYSNTLKKLIEADCKTDELTIWGNKVLNEDGTIQSLGAILNSKYMTTKHNYQNSIDKNYNFHIERIDYIHGCSIFFSKDIIKINGFLSEDFFLFYEDVDFSLRALNNNISLKILQESVVMHKEGVTIKKFKLEYLSLLSRIKFCKIHYPDTIRFVYLGIFYEFIKNIFLFRFNRNYKIVKGMVK